MEVVSRKVLDVKRDLKQLVEGLRQDIFGLDANIRPNVDHSLTVSSHLKKTLECEPKTLMQGVLDALCDAEDGVKK